MLKKFLIPAIFLIAPPMLVLSCSHSQPKNEAGAASAIAESDTTVVPTDSIIGEDLWVYDELDPWTHAVRAHEAYRADDTVSAIGGVQKAVEIMIEETDLAQGEAKMDLQAATREMVGMADSLQRGFLIAPDDFDKVLAHTQLALSRYHRDLARDYFDKKDYLNAGRQLMAATRNAEYAQIWLQHLLDPESRDLIKNLLDTSQKLAGGIVMDDASVRDAMNHLNRVIALAEEDYVAS
jgi:hypothetical protein